MGQMASYVDGIVPDEHKAAYEAALAELRAHAPSSTWSDVRALVEEDLGAPIDRLFASFDENPFASASIGQVHRATRDDGRVVAVKVQHPGISKAVESDLANAGLIETVARVGGGAKLDTKGVLEVVRTRFREELDYRLEAERQETFRTFHAGDPEIRIPAIIADRSSRRVLTSDLATGTTLEAVTTWSESTRRRTAETLWRFVFRGNLVLGLFNADPHPGNYLFGDDGIVTFLDFGCCQPIEGERLLHAARLHARGRDSPRRGRFSCGGEGAPRNEARALRGLHRRLLAAMLCAALHVAVPHDAGLRIGARARVARHEEGRPRAWPRT